MDKSPEGLQNLMKIQMNLLKKNTVSLKKKDRPPMPNFEAQGLPHFSTSKIDVTESNDGFKCYENEIHLPDFESHTPDPFLTAMN